MTLTIESNRISDILLRCFVLTAVTSEKTLSATALLTGMDRQDRVYSASLAKGLLSRKFWYLDISDQNWTVSFGILPSKRLSSAQSTRTTFRYCSSISLDSLSLRCRNGSFVEWQSICLAQHHLWASFSNF